MATYAYPNSQTTTVNGTPVAGLLQSISTGGGNVGATATSPNQNLTKPQNTLPSSQTASQDLSGLYANVGGTIYSKGNNTAFSDPSSFAKSAGLDPNNIPWASLKFDTNWKPPAASPPQGTLPALAAANTNAPITNNVAAPTPNPAPAASGDAATTTPSTDTTTPASPFYTPPNQGTTGVSQGGIIGNQITNAVSNPSLDKANKNLQDLQNAQAQSEANIDSEPIDLSLASGQTGILQRLYAAKLGAAQTAVSNALAGQANTTNGLNGAASANAPITGVQPGTQNISPSQPVNGMNQGQGGTATTSGAASLSSLIGQRPSPSNPSVTEFYNTQTGQGFSSPQALADFVNQQMPNANATAQNVFSLLKSGAVNNGNQGNSALNPLNNVTSIAQQVISGQISPNQAYAMGGSVSNWQGVLNQELQKQQPGFDQSAAQAKYDANQNAQGDQAKLVAQYTSAKQQAQNLTKQFSSLLTSYGLNPSEINVGNGAIQAIARNTSDSRYQALKNYVTDITNTYAQILGAGGTITNDVRDTAQGMIDSLASGQSMTDTIAALDQQAEAKIAGVPTPSTTGNNSNAASAVKGLF